MTVATGDLKLSSMANLHNVFSRSALVFTMGHMIWRFSLMKPSTGSSKHGTESELGERCSKHIESYQTTTTTKCYLQDAQEVCCCDWFDTDWLIDSKINSLLLPQYILYVWCALLHCSVSILQFTDCVFEHARFSRYYALSEMGSLTEKLVNPHWGAIAFRNMKDCLIAEIISNARRCKPTFLSICLSYCG